MNAAPPALQHFAECLRGMAANSRGENVALHLLRLEMNELYEFAWRRPEKLTERPA